MDEATGALQSNWHAGADSPVTALALTPDESTIIVGGTFSSLDGVDVHRLGSVGAVDGAVTDWRPQFPPAVVSLGVDQNGVFVGGIGDGGNFASFDLATGATRWLGGTDGNVQAVALYDGIVYVGGHYENYCGAAPGTHLCPTPTPRSKALAIGSLTGLLQPWHPVGQQRAGDLCAGRRIRVSRGGRGLHPHRRQAAARLRDLSRAADLIGASGNRPRRAAARRADYARRAAMETLRELEGVTA